VLLAISDGDTVTDILVITLIIAVVIAVLEPFGRRYLR